jgi:hypothetical protein
MSLQREHALAVHAGAADLDAALRWRIGGAAVLPVRPARS